MPDILDRRTILEAIDAFLKSHDPLLNKSEYSELIRLAEEFGLTVKITGTHGGLSAGTVHGIKTYSFMAETGDRECTG